LKTEDFIPRAMLPLTLTSITTRRRFSIAKGNPASFWSVPALPDKDAPFDFTHFLLSAPIGLPGQEGSKNLLITLSESTPGLAGRTRVSPRCHQYSLALCSSRSSPSREGRRVPTITSLGIWQSPTPRRRFTGCLYVPLLLCPSLTISCLG
jgi:hypothetical protein